MHRKSGIDILLHDHIDGSIAMLYILERLYEIANKPFPFPGYKDLQDLHAKVRDFMNNVQLDIVERFGMLTGVLQSKDALFLLGETYVKTRAKEGIRYVEGRFAPQYHVFGGLTEQEALDALLDGMAAGEEECPQIEANVIASVGREVDWKRAVELVEIFSRSDRSRVVGVDLVCDEAGHGPEKHIPMYREAQRLGFKTTCHAGEWVSDEPNFEKDFGKLLRNVEIAVYDMQVNRIGHATPLGRHLQHPVQNGHNCNSNSCVTEHFSKSNFLYKELAEFEIGVEGCPGSNLSSKLIPNTLCLEIRTMLQQGILYSMSPDDDLFLPNIEQTFEICDAGYRFSQRERKQMRLNAWKTRFGNRKPVPADIAPLL